MTVQIKGAIYPGFAGYSGRISFKTTQKTHEEKNLIHRGTTNHTAQLRRISEVKVILEKFSEILCEADLKLGTQAGHQFLQGKIEIYSQSAMIASQRMLSSVNAEVSCFAQDHPQSSFTITFSQSVTELTKLHNPRNN
jgi:hypothetical protein